MNGFLVLETGEVYQGMWMGGSARAGEIVFNTSHTGFEEMATDPSYFSQILVTSAPMQGNYGVEDKVWESSQIHIRGFVCLEIQNSKRDSSWLNRLTHQQIPVLTEIDTRKLIFRLRDKGTVWGALVQEKTESEAIAEAKTLIEQAKMKEKDWAHLVSVKEPTRYKGSDSKGPKIAMLDFGFKMNILRELQKRSSEICVFPSRISFEAIEAWSPDGILLSNGPGDPKNVIKALDTIKSLLGKYPIFGICMGHQLLSLSLGYNTYSLKFGHRGSNHPIKDSILGKVYVTAQNHGYAVEDTGEHVDDIEVTHVNLNDQTIAGIRSKNMKCMSVQFHPESHPGPHDAENLFDYFIKDMVGYGSV